MRIMNREDSMLKRTALLLIYAWLLTHNLQAQTRRRASLR
jgi:hypothetical protein